MKIIGYICGFVTGLCLVFFILFLSMYIGSKFSNKKKNFWNYLTNDKHYDERQLLARGIAWKWSFWVTAFSAAALTLLNEKYFKYLNTQIKGFVPLLIGIMFFASVCIWKEAYISIYENVPGTLFFLILATLVNVVVCLTNAGELLHKKDFWIKFQENVSFLNFIVVIMLMIITIQLILKVLYDKLRGEADEES